MKDLVCLAVLPEASHDDWSHVGGLLWGGLVKGRDQTPASWHQQDLQPGRHDLRPKATQFEDAIGHSCMVSKVTQR